MKPSSRQLDLQWGQKWKYNFWIAGVIGTKSFSDTRNKPDEPKRKVYMLESVTGGSSNFLSHFSQEGMQLDILLSVKGETGLIGAWKDYQKLKLDS